MHLDPEVLFSLAVEADRHLSGHAQQSWLERLDQQRSALESLLEQFFASGDSDRALRLAGALARFWWMRGATAFGRERLEQALGLPDGSEEARALALVGAGSLAYAAGDFRGARRYYEEALPFLRMAGRDLELARALDAAGMASRQLMDLAEARSLHAQALEIHSRVGSASDRALCLNNLGVVAFFEGHFDAARTYHEEALALRRQVGDIRGQASSLNNLGQVARFTGDLLLARTCMEQGLALRQQLGDPWGVAGSQVNLAAVQAHLGEPESARAYLAESVAGFRAVGDPLGLCECLEAEAELAQVENRLADAVRCFSAATRHRECLPAPRSPLLDRAVREWLAQLREALGQVLYEVAWQQGQEA